MNWMKAISWNRFAIFYALPSSSEGLLFISARTLSETRCLNYFI